MSVRHIVVCAATALLAAAAASPSSAQELTRVSVATGGAQANDASGAAVLSSDGHVVAFVSNATNLVAGDANASVDVFVRDLTGATTTRVSLAQDGLERTGNSGSLSSAYLGAFIDREIDISANGRFVVFTSRAALVTGDTNTCVVAPDTTASNCPDVYLRDRQTNQTTRLSEATGNANANGASRKPRISADGRFVAFESDASNLVASDTNGVTDVFLLDRQTGALTRVSQATGGGQADSASTAPSISDDGSAVAFLSASTLLSSEPDAVPCERTPSCRRAFVHDRVAATTRKIQLTPTATTGTFDTGQGTIPYTIRFEVGSVDLSADGSSVAVNAGGVWDLNGSTGFPITTQLPYIYYRTLDRFEAAGPTTSWDGRRYTYLDIISTRALVFGQFGIGDIVSGDRENIGPFNIPSEPLIDNASADGLLVLYSTLGADLPDDTNAVRDVYLQNRDRDGDGLPTGWEARFGFDSSVGGDGAGDADGDGVTNAAEYQRGSHPRGTFVRYLAEGASNGFFSTTTSVANLGTTGAVVVARYLGDNGLIRTTTFELAAGRRQDLPSFNLPASSFSTTVESDAQVVVDRLMLWGQGGYGSSAETAIPAPATEWFLAEGATHGQFELFYLLQNPGTAAATVDITYLRPAPAAPLTRQYTVGPESRLTIPVDTIAELAATDVSARIVSSVPILVERSMYMNVASPAQVFGAGHAGAGISAVNTRWFLAEGATGSFFDLYYLLANPSTTPTRVRIRYLLPTGAPIVKEYNLAAQSRLTISVDGEDARLLDTPVSAIVESLDAVGIVVERSMWWPGGGNWQEGHLSAGTTTAARRWGLAAGQVGGDNGAETYVLIANPTSTAGTATVTLLPPQFGQPVTRTVPLAPNSRVSIPMSGMMTPELQALSPFFATKVESDGPDIVVERAIYSNANGIVWAAGSVALGTPLP